MKLKELHIHNFKFFPKQDPSSPLLKIDGKNLLIYGENGSGKSTIYWALYTLFESSFKKDNTDVSKYFTKGGEHGLVNIFATNNHNAHVKVVLTDGTTTTEYKISGDNADISAMRANSAVRESAMASDFLNYRALFSLHHVKHSSENNLFPWFEYEVLPYVRKAGGDTFSERIQILRQGPRRVSNLAGDDIFANPALQHSADAGERGNYRFYGLWDRNIKRWAREFRRFLNDINTRANEILENDFKISLKIKLTLTEPRYNIQNLAIEAIKPLEHLKWQEPQIKITVPDYQTKRNAIKRPHSFLNEAKWTAIGLSIRLAILEDYTYRPQPTELQCLVIDDMLLSLDMSNRDIVLDLLLTRYTQDYQLILMTHDRFFFELAQYKINQLRQTNWMKLEMFDKKNNNRNEPLIIEATSKIKKAWALFYSGELDLAANTIRKGAEKLCKAYLTHQEKLNGDYTPMNLHNMLVAFETKGRANGLDGPTLTKLIEYKDRILNPNSHYDIQTPLFSTELKKAIEALERISNDTGIII